MPLKEILFKPSHAKFFCVYFNNKNWSKMYLGLPDIVSNKNRREEGRFFCVCNKNPSLYLAATQSVCSHGDYGGQKCGVTQLTCATKVFYSSPLFGFKAAQHGHVTSKVESLYKLFKVFFFKGYLSDCVVAVQHAAYATFLKPDFLPFSKGSGGD